MKRLLMMITFGMLSTVASAQTLVQSDEHLHATQQAEVKMLPVHSVYLSPGDESRRTIHAPGLTPLFLIGDDQRSRWWLHQHQAELRKLNALGLVVNVMSVDALASLRQLAPGLTLAPASSDDLAQRLGIHHYPVLITATDIEP